MPTEFIPVAKEKLPIAVEFDPVPGPLKSPAKEFAPTDVVPDPFALAGAYNSRAGKLKRQCAARAHKPWRFLTLR